MKKLFHIFFLFIFWIMLENPALPSWEFSFPMTNYSMQSSPNISPSSQQLPPTKKIPLKTSVHFPITVTVCKHWSKFVTCSPFPRDCGGVSHPQRHYYYCFRLCWTKWLSQNFDPLTGKKMSVGGGLDALQFFGHLKRALELLFPLEWALLRQSWTAWSIRWTLGKERK